MENKTCANCGTLNLANAKFCNRCGFELPAVITEKIEISQEQTKVSSTLKRKRLLGIAVGLIAASITYWAVQNYFFGVPSYDKAMMQVASELNKTCPIMVDEYTQLDNAVALPNNTFQYNYTLVDLLKEEVNIDTVKKYIEPAILNNVRSNPDMKYFRDNNTTLVYYYKDKSGVFVHKYSVTPEMYR